MIITSSIRQEYLQKHGHQTTKRYHLKKVDGNVADKHNMHTKTLLNHVRAHNTTISSDQSTSTPIKTYSPAEIRKLHRQIQRNKRELYGYAQQNDQSLEESLHILFTNMEYFLVFRLVKNCFVKSMHDMTELVEQKDRFFDVLALRNFTYDTCVYKRFKQMCADQARIFANHEFEKKLAIFPEFGWLGGCIDALDEQVLNDRAADLVVAFYVMGKYEQFMDGIMMEYAFMKDENEGNNMLGDDGNNILEDEASTTSKDEGNNTMRNIKYNTTSNTLGNEEGNTSNNTTKNAKSNATNNSLENLNTKTLEKDQHVRYTADGRKSDVGNNKTEILGEKSFDKKNATHTSTQTRTIRVLTKNQNLTKVFVREVLIGYLINSFLCDRYLTVAYDYITRLSFDYFCRKEDFKIVLNRTSDSFYDFLFRHLIIVQRTLHERSIFNTLLTMRHSPGLPAEFKEIHGVILSNNLAGFNIPTYEQDVQMTEQPSDMNTLYEEHMNEMYMSREFVYTGSSGYNLLAYSSY
ncbi:hypothetical protein THOM_2308 [Trachipleistophora hominis]|uniref:Uncharacterized protein n=1 Tax=Trachipleistophora hominis TaxID=72359 RepID=L7JVI7_TRAHO|nr:hypothetical protein THOM_2308 [Trachipleistophora hominis]